MGVKQCGRAGCREVMCERFSLEFGYLCDECFCELEDFVKKQGIPIGVDDIEYFLSTRRQPVINIHDEFKKEY